MKGSREAERLHRAARVIEAYSFDDARRLWKWHGSTTGRLTGSQPAIQNIPIRPNDHSRLRAVAATWAYRGVYGSHERGFVQETIPRAPVHVTLDDFITFLSDIFTPTT